MKTWRVIVLGVLLGSALFLGLRHSMRHKEHSALPPEIAKILMSLPSYATLNEAAVEALQRAYTCSHYYECAGVIAIRPDGRYVVGPVHTDYNGDAVTANEHVPPGWKMAADFHTHPCLPKSHYPQYFSPTDTAGNISRHTLGFVADLCTGEVHFFNYLTMRPDNVALPDGDFVTSGQVMGQILVDGIELDADEGL